MAGVGLKYASGNHYSVSLGRQATATVERRSKSVLVQFSSGQGKESASLSLSLDSAQRLARALLLSAPGDVEPIELRITDNK